MPGWVSVTTNTPQADVRLFCFAHGGGGAAAFRPWRAALAGEIEVCPVLLPGRESRVRETPYRRMEDLIDPLCDALTPYLDRPFALFGHSLGSIIAYEVARRLNPMGLIVSGRRPPHLPTGRYYSILSDDEFLVALGRLGGTPAVVLSEPQLLKMLLPALRADFELNEAYTPLPGPPLTCPVIAYMGIDDPEVDPTGLLRWRETSPGELTLRVFAGDHFYLHKNPSVLDALRQDVERLTRSQPLVGLGVHA